MILKKMLVYSLIAALLAASLQSCAMRTQEKHFRQSLEKYLTDKKLGSNIRVVEIVTMDGKKEYLWTHDSFYDPSRRIIIGRNLDSANVSIKIDSIMYARVAAPDVPATALANFLWTVPIILIAAALLSSCPFVYSWDGQKYSFNAEPLGGAICKGLQRTDWVKLEDLAFTGGNAKVLLKNELQETQMIDQLSLLYFDHEKNKVILPDWQGNFFAADNPEPPAEAFDENGKSILSFIGKNDNIFWQTSPNAENDGPARHSLTFKFRKPANTSKIGIVYNAGTSRWGSMMIRELLELYGDRIDDWYSEVNSGGSEMVNLLKFNEREEHLFMKLYLKENDDWVPKGFLSGGGPMIYEDRIVWINVSNVKGDTIEFKINPPKTFWSIDFIGLVGSSRQVAPQEAKLANARGLYSSGDDEKFRMADGIYYKMPETGDSLELEFSAPKPSGDLTRSSFLRIAGYYDIKLPKNKPAQSDLIREIINKNGRLVDFSFDKMKEQFDKK